MTASNKWMRQKATSNLTHVGNSIQDVDFEIYFISKELEMLSIAREDAKWAGDTNKVNSIRYKMMLRNTMRKILHKRRKKLLEEKTE